MRKELIGKRLRELREEKGQPKTFVAKQLGICYRTYCSYEYGERIPGDEAKVKIADYYGLSVEDIFFTKHNYETR